METDVRKLTVEDLLYILSDRLHAENSYELIQKLKWIAERNNLLEAKE